MKCRVLFSIYGLLRNYRFCCIDTGIRVYGILIHPVKFAVQQKKITLQIFSWNICASSVIYSLVEYQLGNSLN